MQVEAESARWAAELAGVRRQLEAAVDAARSDAEGSGRELAQVTTRARALHRLQIVVHDTWLAPASIGASRCAVAVSLAITTYEADT